VTFTRAGDDRPYKDSVAEPYRRWLSPGRASRLRGQTRLTSRSSGTAKGFVANRICRPTRTNGLVPAFLRLVGAFCQQRARSRLRAGTVAGAGTVERCRGVDVCRESENNKALCRYQPSYGVP
jgi:hypothetical protein